MGVKPPSQSATQQALKGDVVVMNSADGTRVRALVRLDSVPPLVLMIGRPVDPQILGYMKRTEQAVSEYQRLAQNRSWLCRSPSPGSSRLSRCWCCWPPC